MEVPPQKDCWYAFCCTPLVSVRSAKVALLAKVRLQRGQRRSPQGRPLTCCSLSWVVRQMGQARSKVRPLALAVPGAAAAAAPEAPAELLLVLLPAPALPVPGCCTEAAALIRACCSLRKGSGARRRLVGGRNRQERAQNRRNEFR